MAHDERRGTITYIGHWAISLLLVALGFSFARAQAPDSISFQGFLTSAGGAPLNTTASITFKLYKNNVQVWSETQPSVTVTNGIFSVFLGSVSPLEAVAFDQTMELGIKVGADPEIVPRTPIAAAAFALGVRGMHAVWAENASDQRAFNLIGGASNNTVGGGVTGATIGGGGGNQFGDAPVSFANQVNASFGTIGGGTRNKIGTGGAWSVIGGGSTNLIEGSDAVVGGGSRNTASGLYSTVPGGNLNRAAGAWSFAAGYKAKAVHNGTFVWNDRSVSSGNDSLVSTAANQFLIRAAGGVAIGTNSPRAMLTLRGPNDPIMGPSILFFGNASDQFESGRIRFVEGTGDHHRGGYIHYDGDGNRLHIGVHNTNDLLVANDVNSISINRGTGNVGVKQVNPGHPLHVGSDATNGNGAHVTITGTWTNGSSRTFKTGFEKLDKIDVLERLAALEVTKWTYKGYDRSAHIGPTAEDFREAFGLGHDERYITTVDADGVALAAIQGLYEKVLALQAELEVLKAKVGK